MNQTKNDIVVTSLAGLTTGFLSGLVGLGGAELRLPFILYTLKVPVREMIPMNLIISLITSGSNFVTRWQAGLFPVDTLPVSISMIFGSVAGGFFGPKISCKMSIRKLEAFLVVVLLGVISRLVINLFVEAEPASLFPISFAVVFAALIGFGIGLIAGTIGVAGGEYRIPALVFLFGYSIKIAGTVSQLVTIPTMIVSILKHNQQKAVGRNVIKLSTFMGLGSFGGVLLSGIVLSAVPNVIIESIFILILSYTVLRLIQDIAKNRHASKVP